MNRFQLEKSWYATIRINSLGAVHKLCRLKIGDYYFGKSEENTVLSRIYLALLRPHTEKVSILYYII